MSARALVGALVMALTLVRTGYAEPPPTSGARELNADIECAEAERPGRVHCSIDARATGGAIAWIDVAIVHVGGGARPLRARLGPADVAARSAERARFEFALIAPHAGRGRIVTVTHALLCRKDDCTPIERRSVGDYVVVREPAADAGAP